MTTQEKINLISDQEQDRINSLIQKIQDGQITQLSIISDLKNTIKSLNNIKSV